MLFCRHSAGADTYVQEAKQVVLANDETATTGGDATVTATDSLVSRCRRGDEHAFEELYRLYAARIYRHLRALLGPVPEVDDALQLVFLEAFRNIERFEGRSQFSTWLHGIAVRVVFNQARARRRRNKAMSALTDESETTAPSRSPTPERVVDARQQTSRLYRHLEAVDEEKRAAFVLFYVEQLELSEVATQLGISADAAGARIKRGRAQLLRALEREQLATARRIGSVQ